MHGPHRRCARPRRRSAHLAEDRAGGHGRSVPDASLREARDGGRGHRPRRRAPRPLREPGQGLPHRGVGAPQCTDVLRDLQRKRGGPDPAPVGALPLGQGVRGILLCASADRGWGSRRSLLPSGRCRLGRPPGTAERAVSHERVRRRRHRPGARGDRIVAGRRRLVVRPRGVGRRGTSLLAGRRNRPVGPCGGLPSRLVLQPGGTALRSGDRP